MERKMKARNLGGREPILENAGSKSIVFGEEQRRIIANRKGDRGISEYIRDLVMADDDLKEELDEIRLIRDENILLKKELKQYKRIDAKMTEEKQGVMTYIAKGLELYEQEDARRAKEPEMKRRWIESRCKGSGISTNEFLAFRRSL